MNFGKWSSQLREGVYENTYKVYPTDFSFVIEVSSSNPKNKECDLTKEKKVADLISAAPELFNALIAMLSIHDDGDSHFAQQVRAGARQALKKATGLDEG